jgi:DNA helicase-2/ATP-dependent DNA helicase PcrA
MNHLDLQQCAAVKSPHKNTLVIAGAGSGKTRVLVERIAHLIEKRGVSPSEIMAITFTRKASAEMLRRLEERIGHDAYRIRIGTIHAIALRYVRMFGQTLGIRPMTVTVYGEWEENFLARDTAGLVKAKPGYKESLEKFYQTGNAPDEDDPHHRFFSVFMNRLRSNNSLTYGMLLAGMKTLVPEIAKHPLKHILVDEAQDLDSLQWHIVQYLQSLSDCSVFAVGDIDQSIYAWRGAIPEYLISLKSTYELFRLENNYRSAAVVVASANALIENNIRRITKTMHPHRQDPGRMEVCRNMDSAAVALALAEMKEKHPRIAVLSRAHALLVKLSQELELLNVKHHYCGHQSTIMRSEEFRRAHAVFKLLQNRFDNFSFTLARPHLGVVDSQYMEIMRDAMDNLSSHVDSWLKLYASEKWKAVFNDSQHENFGALVKRLQKMVDNFDFAAAAKIAMGFAETGGSLRKYLDWVTTFDLQEEVQDPEQEGIQLMTIHAAKGLEFPVVVIVGMNEGILPSKQSMSAGDIEEERRLAYVAITRAQDNLHLCVRPEVTESKGKTYANPTSRFVHEMSL